MSDVGPTGQNVRDAGVADERANPAQRASPSLCITAQVYALLIKLFYLSKTVSLSMRGLNSTSDSNSDAFSDANSVDESVLRKTAIWQEGWMDSLTDSFIHPSHMHLCPTKLTENSAKS